MSLQQRLSGISNITADNMYSNFYSDVSNVKISYLANVSSDIQGQIDAIYGAIVEETVLNISDTTGLMVN